MLAERGKYFETVPAGQHYVHYDEIESLRARDKKRLFTGMRDMHLVPFGFEALAERFSDLTLVLYDQNSHLFHGYIVALQPALLKIALSFPDELVSKLSGMRFAMLVRLLIGRIPSKRSATMHLRMLLRAVAATAIISLCSFCLQAPNTPSKRGKTRGTVSVTGCLQKGDEAGEFSITGADGKTYGLRSTSVKLADHLGHKVTVTGRAKPEEKEEKEKGSKEVADLTVTNLKMVSTSCP